MVGWAFPPKARVRSAEKFTTASKLCSGTACIISVLREGRSVSSSIPCKDMHPPSSREASLGSLLRPATLVREVHWVALTVTSWVQCCSASNLFRLVQDQILISFSCLHVTKASILATVEPVKSSFCSFVQCFSTSTVSMTAP